MNPKRVAQTTPRPELSTLVDLLRWRSTQESNRLAYSFLADGEGAEQHLTLGDLDLRARAIAAWLQQETSVGDRVLLLFMPGLDYIAAFFGCLYAGVIAVPAYPPRSSQRHRGRERLRAIFADAGVALTLTSSAVAEKVEAFFKQEAGSNLPRRAVTDLLPDYLASDWREPSIKSDSIAFLQYTSGSTATPKGVMVTHANLINNERMIEQTCGHTAESTFVGWLPLYHDMGLIGNVLQPLYIGARAILMPPTAFLQRPVLWLKAISAYGGRTSGGPNFAYEMCVRKISADECQNLDLSSWTVAFNGAEPVHQETMDRFATAFAPYGFQRDAFLPCYGLAEASLIVSGGPKPGKTTHCVADARALEAHRLQPPSYEGAPERVLVGCGAPVADTCIRIVDPDTQVEYGPGEVGEIWVAGPAVAAGYWNQPERSASVFHARLSGSDYPFLRTGDLGLIHDGELYVTGRLNDLIIIRGQNHHPEDIEWTVQQCSSDVRVGAVAAFSVPGESEERLVIFIEVERNTRVDAAALMKGVRDAVAACHEVQPYAVLLINTGRIPKTSSGKVQRHACSAAFIAGTIEAVGMSVYSGSDGEPSLGMLTREEILAADERSRMALLERSLADQLAVMLGATSIGTDQPLTSAGLDSLLAVRLKAWIESLFGVDVPATDLLDSMTVCELAGRILNGLRAGQHAPDLIQAGPTAGPHQLSHGQRALWFFHQIHPGSAAYNIARALHINGPLNRARLQKAWQSLLDRHAALRATFSGVGPGAQQYIHPHTSLWFQEENAEHWSTEQLAARVQEEAERPFDLEHGPVLRAHLFARSSEEHLLLICVHHIVIDLRSFGVLLREFDALYDGKPLARPALQFTDYVRYHDRLLCSDEGQRLAAFWERKLAEPPPYLNLLSDMPRPAIRTFEGAECRFSFGSQLSERIHAVCRSYGVTPFLLLLAGFQVVLYRYTRQNEFLVGAPSAARSRPELAEVVGYITNIVPLRARVDGDGLFTEFLDQTRREALEAFAHEDYPFSLIAERFEGQRDASQPPLPVVFAYHDAARFDTDVALPGLSLGHEQTRLTIGDLQMNLVPIEQRTAQFDITLTMTEVGGQFHGVLNYDRNLFEAETVSRMGRHLTTLLNAVAAAPRTYVRDLPLLDDAEREDLLRYNISDVSYDASRCIHQSFADRVLLAPHSIAASCAHEHLTYAELDARANQLAHYLIALGARPEARVALLMDRSLDMLVAILAVLKAGGAYVPIDISNPPERIAYVLEDAEACLLITESALRDTTASQPVRSVILDDEWDVIKHQPASDPEVFVRPDNAAYIIYTSGSTGRPKGVTVIHANVARLLAATEAWFHFGRDDVWTIFHSYAFDFSVWEMWASLLHGGRVIIVPYEVSRSPLDFLFLLADEQVTMLNQTPSAFRELMAAEQTCDRCELALRFVIFGGEALDPRSLCHWFERHAEAAPRLVNMYGITETTVHVTYRPLSHADAVSDGGSRIGRAIPDLQLYVLDEHLCLVPMGVAGELYVGGAGLARGYLNQPALTASRFLPNPFAGREGGRLYRTGDLVCWRAGGDLEYLGRIDQQVKIRGLRIELGEIEAALSEHQDLQSSIVVVDQRSAVDSRLVAYFVPRLMPAPSSGDLRAFLARKLPGYMIPAAFVALDAIPLNANGKLDRNALPTPAQSRPELYEEYVGPRTSLEEVLALHWSSVLGLDRTGIYDNFFELGGHSLLLTRLAAQLQDIFPTGTPMLTLLFQNPTVATLAEAIAANNTAPQDAEEVAQLWQRVQSLSDEKVQAMLHGANEDEPALNSGLVKET